jgi:hypothetical protein
MIWVKRRSVESRFPIKLMWLFLIGIFVLIGRVVISNTRRSGYEAAQFHVDQWLADARD